MIGGPPPGKVLLLLMVALHVIVAVTAVALARRLRDYRPAAIFLGVTALADVLLVGALLAGAPMSVPAAPFEGAERAWFHVRQAAYLTWPFGLVALSLAVFARRRPQLVGLAYIVFLAVLSIGYPTIRGDLLRRTYLAVEIGSVMISFGLLIQWGWQRAWPSLPQLTPILLIIMEAGVLLAAWSGDIFGGWDVGRGIYTVTYAALLILQGRALWGYYTASS